MAFIIFVALLNLSLTSEAYASNEYHLIAKNLHSSFLLNDISIQMPTNSEQDNLIADGTKKNENDLAWLDTPLKVSAIISAIVVCTIFFLTQFLLWRQRRIKTKDAKTALLAELRISKGFLKQVFSHIKNEEKKLKNEITADFYDQVKVFKSTLPKALSTHIFSRLDNSQLRKTSVIESIISLYTNINVFSAFCENKLSESNKTELNKQDVKLFTFWIFILHLQIEVNLNLLNSKWYNIFPFKRAQPVTIVNIEFFHSIWGMAENTVDQREVNLTVLTGLQAIRNRAILFFGLVDHFSFEGQNDREYFTVVSHEEVAVMLEAINSSDFRREYNDDYAWILKAFKD